VADGVDNGVLPAGRDRGGNHPKLPARRGNMGVGTHLSLACLFSNPWIFLIWLSDSLVVLA
jgi:hypothetical protein